MALLIDGYNLLYAIGLLGKGLGPGGLERSRLALVAHLAAALEPDELAQTTIVFDAADAPKGLPPELLSHGLSIRFSVGYEDADTLIEELIRRHPNPRRLVVVSSDHRLQRAARRRKATSVDSEKWYDGLLKRRERSQRTGGAEARESEVLPLEEEVAYWLGQFGGESLVEEVQSEERTREEAAGNERTAVGPVQGKSAPPDKLTPEEAAEIGNPFPPGYGEELLEEQPPKEETEG